jgi:hypothetical protein
MALRALLAAGLLVVAGLCRAQPLAYSAGIQTGSDGSQIVYLINLASGAPRALGTGVGSYNNAPITTLNNFAFDKTGTILYAIGQVQGSTQAALVSINPNSGQNNGLQWLSGFSAQSAANLSMSSTCDGKLWLADSGGGNLYQVTPGTGQTQTVGSLGATITGLATYQGKLYGFGGLGNAGLYTIDTGSGKATLVGAYGVSASNAVNASVDSNGTLWTMIQNASGSSQTLPQQGNALGQVNAARGAMSLVGNVSNPSDWSLNGYYETFKGLAIGAPNCSDVIITPPATNLPTAPALSLAGSTALILLLLISVGVTIDVRLRR